MPDKEEIRVWPVRREDAREWARLRRQLFPDFDPPEIEDFFEREGFPGFAHSAVFVAGDGETLIGFAEAAARPYAEGCRTTPVAYLEAWFVDEKYRRIGVGKMLVDAVGDWGRSLGMTEMASDTDLSNHVSQKAHAALGFDEAERIVCFAKKL
jgi:aminoglycoside 6'-N-acetyltransferase I